MSTILDLYCGAGGVSVGLRRAGWHTVGVDIRSSPRYPFDGPGEFLQMDISALTPASFRQLVRRTGAIAAWASPPCQGYSITANVAQDGPWNPRLIPHTRDLLRHAGLPHIIENVETAPLETPIMLCGGMFGLCTYRHRIFECSPALPQPRHPAHTHPTAKMSRIPAKGEYASIAGNTLREMARSILQVPWMSANEASQCIPPRYAHHLGAILLQKMGLPRTPSPIFRYPEHPGGFVRREFPHYHRGPRPAP